MLNQTITSYCFHGYEKGVEWCKQHVDLSAFAKKTTPLSALHFSLQTSSLFASVRKMQESGILDFGRKEQFQNLFLVFSTIQTNLIHTGKKICDFLQIQNHLSLYDYSNWEIFVHSGVEEVACRYLVQKIFFQSIAWIAPRKIRPLIAHKWTRIVTSSIFFALLHTQLWNAPYGPANQFLSGLVYGHIGEKYGLFASTIFHAGHNKLVALNVYLKVLDYMNHTTRI